MRFVQWGVLFALATSSVAFGQGYPDSLGIRVAFDFPIPTPNTERPIGSGLDSGAETTNVTPALEFRGEPSFQRVPFAERISPPNADLRENATATTAEPSVAKPTFAKPHVAPGTATPQTQSSGYSPATSAPAASTRSAQEFYYGRTQGDARTNNANPRSVYRPSGTNSTFTYNTALQEVEKMTIPQQGTVDLGNSPQYQPYSPSHSDHASTCCGGTCDSSCGGSCRGSANGDKKRTCLTGVRDRERDGLFSGMIPNGNRRRSKGQSGCSDCGTESCLGSCKLGKLSKYIKLNPDFSCSGWFAGAYYLNLTRDDDSLGSLLATSGGSNAIATGMARMDRTNGLAGRVGKMMNANTAFEVIYWQLFPNDERTIAASSLTGNPLDANFSFGSLTYDNGAGAQPVDSYFQGAQSMTLTRSFDYRNFEFNFLRLPFSLSGCGAGKKTNLALVAGFRYFEAEEGLELFSDLNNEIRGDVPNDEVAYSIDTENQLAGVQVGALLNYQISRKLYGQFGTKVGLYNNHMEQRQYISGGNGAAMIGGQPFDVTAEKDDVAFLAEIDAGLAYSFTDHWRMNVGYKLLTVSSYADASSQLLSSFTIPEAGQIQDNNSLILHGLFIGAEYAW